MAIKTNGGYLCGYCKKFYTDPVEAENCKESHHLLYIPISKEDLNRLIMFIYSKNDELLDDRVVEMLQGYMRSSITALKE